MTPPASRRRALGVLAATAAGFASPLVSAAVATQAAAPDFTLKSMNGPNLRLAEQRGRVVMVNFWATWCGPCRQELPQLNRLYEKYRSAGLVVLGVNLDDDQRKANDLAGQLGLKFPVLLDTDKAVSRLYGVSAMPSTLLIDRDGKVRYVHLGYLTGYEEMYDRQIRELIK